MESWLERDIVNCYEGKNGYVCVCVYVCAFVRACECVYAGDRALRVIDWYKESNRNGRAIEMGEQSKKKNEKEITVLRKKERGKEKEK